MAALVLANSFEGDRRLSTDQDYYEMMRFLRESCGLTVVANSKHANLQYRDTLCCINKFFGESHSQHVLVIIGGDPDETGLLADGRSLHPKEVLSLWSPSIPVREQGRREDDMYQRNLFIFVCTCYDAKWAVAAAQAGVPGVSVQCATISEREFCERWPTKSASRVRRMLWRETPDAYDNTYTFQWVRYNVDGSKRRTEPGKGTYYSATNDRRIKIGSKFVYLTGSRCVEHGVSPDSSAQVVRPVPGKSNDGHLLMDGSDLSLSYGAELDRIANSSKDSCNDTLNDVLDWWKGHRRTAGCSDIESCSDIEIEILAGILNSCVYRYWGNHDRECEELEDQLAKAEKKGCCHAILCLILANLVYTQSCSRAQLKVNGKCTVDHVTLMLFSYDQCMPSALVRGAVHAALGRWFSRTGNVERAVDNYEKSGSWNRDAHRDAAATSSLLQMVREQLRALDHSDLADQMQQLKHIWDCDPSNGNLRNRLSFKLLQFEVLDHHASDDLPQMQLAYKDLRAAIQKCSAQNVYTDQRDHAEQVVRESAAWKRWGKSLHSKTCLE